jgi:hypothetical protein
MEAAALAVTLTMFVIVSIGALLLKLLNDRRRAETRARMTELGKPPIWSDPHNPVGI